MPLEQVRQSIELLYRVDSGRILATLIGLLGDFDLAEDPCTKRSAAFDLRHKTGILPANPAALADLTAPVQSRWIRCAGGLVSTPREQDLHPPSRSPVDPRSRSKTKALTERPATDFLLSSPYRRKRASPPARRFG